MDRAKRTASLALASALLVLGGCTTLWSPHVPPAHASSAQGEASDDLDRLVGDASRFSGLSESERRLALESEEKRYQQHQTPYNLIKLALLMTLVEPGQGETDGVIAGLRDYVTARRGQARHARTVALATFLSQVLERHNRLLERNDTLQSKLNELKAIEQKLNEQNKRDMIQVPP